MSLQKMTDKQAQRYRQALDAYRRITDKEPTAPERVEAFRFALSDNPNAVPRWGL